MPRLGVDTLRYLERTLEVLNIYPVFLRHVADPPTLPEVVAQILGADEVIDYTQDDFTTSNQRYDLILECVGNHSFSECRRVLTAAGRLVMVGAPHEMSVIGLLASMIKPLLLSLFVSQRAVIFIAKSSQEDLTLLGELIVSRKLKPVIDGRYSLSDAANAIRIVEEGHARGKVIITLDRAHEI